MKKQLALETALQTIEIEIAALEALKEPLQQSPDFCALVEEIHAAVNGRVVLTGIGKSAIVAQKIAATMNSTGQPAIFLHAADAIHGDLGMVQPADVIVCLSKSGETPEIKVLIPLLRHFGNRIAAITSNSASFLAKQADYVLLTPIRQEADPNNLAPTASTTAQMAIGDALATALLALKGFTAGDFAKFHPGGALGKQLYLTVRDLCALHGQPAVNADARLPEILLEMSSHRLGATAVFDQNNQLVGIITDGDLRRMLSKKDIDIQQLTAKEVVTTLPHTIAPDAQAIDALALLRRHSISQLLVLDEQGAYHGMIHLHDLVREGLI